MKVLWVTNSILPELATAMGNKPKPFEGWLLGLKDKLVESGNELIIATAQKDVADFSHNSSTATYYLLNTLTNKSKYDSVLENKWEELIEKIKPDVVHLHGSEHSHGLALVNRVPSLNYVLSIQGLISVYARYYRAGISLREILKSYTIRSFIKGDSILQEQAKFIRRGEKIEKEYFSRVSNFIGRTDWDKTHTHAMNNSSNYYFCNEILRDGFYTSPKWNIKNCNKHTIFLSQGNYPIKGLHQVIKAVALLKNEYPKIKITFAGSDILAQRKGFKEKIKLKDYGNYLKKLIKKLNVENHIEYLGVLSEEQMVNAYLSCNVFICPSSIENSPNSLGEAQILGVPNISSYNGGTPNMIKHGETGYLYRFEEYEQLASYIKNLFDNVKETEKISLAAIKSATQRHDRNDIIKKTISIYENITKK